jgi:hypothetical protein
MTTKRRFIERRRRAYPHSRYEVKRCSSTATSSSAHVRVRGSRGSAHANLFAWQVVEHWDVDVPIPATWDNPIPI